jgi:[ribosomal protein S5]-alanine N-acetyltransferase
MNFENNTFETNRLIIEPLRASHAQEMFVLLKDIELYKYIPTKPPASITSLRNRYRKLETRVSPDQSELWLNWVLKLKTDNILIGRVEATVSLNNTFSIAYELSSKYWGQGLAFESCQKIIEILCVKYDIIKVIANVDTRNFNSIKLLKKLGFKIVEVIKEVDFFNGSSSDEYKLELFVR